MVQEVDRHEFGEAVHEHGEAICDGCNEAIDLSEADTIDEGIEVWNEHVSQDHDDQ